VTIVEVRNIANMIWTEAPPLTPFSTVPQSGTLPDLLAATELSYSYAEFYFLLFLNQESPHLSLNKTQVLFSYLYCLSFSLHPKAKESLSFSLFWKPSFNKLENFIRSLLKVMK
jgi:hypothetical protein